MNAPSGAAERPFVLAVSSNKGGVGKTTIASNLAVYLRALREELPILIASLDDQQTLDRMFSIGPRGSYAERESTQGNLKHAWVERSFDSVIRLGEYGVHFVPAPPDVSLLKSRAASPSTLSGMIDRMSWDGIFILDTKSDLEALTLNAFHAADRILIPVADWASLEEAGKAFRILEIARIDVAKARVLLTLVDRRTKIGESKECLVDRLRDEIRERGWPLYETQISRSPRVEALNSGAAKPLSILHHARGTAVHRQLRALAEEILVEMGASERLEGFVELHGRGFDSREDDLEDNDEPSRREAEVFQRFSRTENVTQEKSWTEELLGAFFRR